MSAVDEIHGVGGLAVWAERPRAGARERFLRACRRHPRIPFFAGLMLIIFTVCLLAPVLAPYGAKEVNTRERLQGPSGAHWFGTDQLGRDTFSRVLYGGRVSLPLPLMAVAIAAVVGTVLGVLAGYYGGALDMVCGRWVDAQLAFPGLLLLIMLVTAFGASLPTVMVVVGLLGFPGYYRLIRGQVLQVREFDFVSAARALGASTARVMFRHVLPNSLNPIIVQTSLAAGGSVLLLANLSFLGLGPSSVAADWGAMFNDALTNFRLQPWLVLGPGLAVFISVLSFYMLGDALRDALDPRLRGRRA
jgi:peptide/nickel transport system permease protein